MFYMTVNYKTVIVNNLYMNVNAYVNVYENSTIAYTYTCMC